MAPSSGQRRLGPRSRTPCGDTAVPGGPRGPTLQSADGIPERRRHPDHRRDPRHQRPACRGAADANEALAIGRRHGGPIHLLLTDVVMPGINGRELAAIFSAERPEARVLYMSGYPDDFVLQAGLAGHIPFLQKPFTPDGLAAALQDALGRVLP
ncbi:MAG: response regulator [Chloroflexi bacterium]|nr:response regulator [Chloroflexota bacterium]